MVGTGPGYAARCVNGARLVTSQAKAADGGSRCSATSTMTARSLLSSFDGLIPTSSGVAATIAAQAAQAVAANGWKC